jgi:hypothetical protein
MKTTHWAFGLLAGCLIAFTGCKKAAQPAGQVQEYYGVKVEWPRLDAEVANASPEVQTAVSRAKRAFRYRQLPQPLVQVDKLTHVPNLTEPQTRLVNDLLELTKQMIAKAPPPGQ